MRFFSVVNLMLATQCSIRLTLTFIIIVRRGVLRGQLIVKINVGRWEEKYEAGLEAFYQSSLMMVV